MVDNNVIEKLKKITSIEKYFFALKDLSSEDYFVIIAVKDTIGFWFNGTIQKALRNLGLKQSLMKKMQCGYIAVINKGDVVYEVLAENQIGVKCNFEIDTYNIDIHSYPFTVGNLASIVIGTAQCSVNARGFNIVVFDKQNQVVIDSVCFDTHLKNYPITRKDCSTIKKNLFRYKVNMTLASQAEQNIQNSLNNVKKSIDEYECHNGIKYWQLFRKDGESELEAKKRFFYNLEVENKEMKIIQEGLGVIFYHFDKICKENNVLYWMVGGSLIGAVRHGKCIPWDDDIDVYMIRSDVDRLIEILKDNKDFTINIKYNIMDKAYIRYLRFMFKNRDIPCFVDVFYIDYVDNSSDETWKQHCELRADLIKKTNLLEAEFESGNKTGNRDLEISNLLDEQVKKEQDLLNRSGKGTALLWSVDQWQFWCKNLFDYDWVFPTRTVPFAYGTCEIPARTEEMLEQWYGDIYSLPNNMLSHKHISLNKKQQEEIKEVMKLYSPKGNL